MRQLRITKHVIQNPIKGELRSRFGHLRFRETATEMKIKKGRNGIWNRKCSVGESNRCSSLWKSDVKKKNNRAAKSTLAIYTLSPRVWVMDGVFMWPLDRFI